MTTGSFYVYCDMDTDGGGWTIRNDRIYALTNQGNYSIRFDLKDKEGNKSFASYREFWIENEDHLYRLHVTRLVATTSSGLPRRTNTTILIIRIMPKPLKKLGGTSIVTVPSLMDST
ncbi:techylectin-5A-like isoform X2 [Tachypleus tridentatus]|uniref:techylectin-5A-like isoform X2 n=1 Tax=Tachypleus tridentatus TaxID=6853 RepID=UPI003FD11ED5